MSGCEQLTSSPRKETARPLGQGRAFGTFGELLQGRLADGDTDFLVTFPIARYSTAVFVPDPGSIAIQVSPSHKYKSRMLAQMMVEYYALPCGGTITLESDLPTGKGLASSSADLVATARSIAAYFELDVPTTLVQAFMHTIEPSDGVMYSGIVSFYHRQGRLREFLGSLPSITIVSIDEGGEVDTIEFNGRPKPFTAIDKQEYQDLLNAISLAIRTEDLRLVGQVATRSSILNQKLNPKHALADVVAICQEIDGLGVAVTHSGPCLGILLSPQDHRYAHQLHATHERLTNLAGTVAIYQSLSFTEGAGITCSAKI